MKRPAAALAPEAELGTGGDSAVGFRVGATVIVDDLKSAPQLNGKTGKLVRSDTSSWRWQVELEEGLGTKALKSANLTIAEAEPGTGREGAVGFSVGTSLFVDGLKGAPELNGKTGKLVRFDTSSSRWQVELEEGFGTEALGSANLTIAEATNCW